MSLWLKKFQMTGIRLIRKGSLLEITSSLKVANGPLKICTTSGQCDFNSETFDYAQKVLSKDSKFEVRDSTGLRYASKLFAASDTAAATDVIADRDSVTTGDTVTVVDTKVQRETSVSPAESEQTLGVSTCASLDSLDKSYALEETSQDGDTAHESESSLARLNFYTIFQPCSKAIKKKSACLSPVPKRLIISKCNMGSFDLSRPSKRKSRCQHNLKTYGYYRTHVNHS